MNQKKTGEFLKCLRKEKGLTQEQLAEKFHVSFRTVSRWETGRNMPDVAMLIALADFYHVDIREVIDGERRRVSQPEIKDTLKKVANYAAEKEKGTQSKVLHTALAVVVFLFACTVLFAGEFTGLLYGIVPEKLCENILTAAYGIAACLLLFYLRAHFWQEKPSAELEKAVMATVVSKEIKAGTQGAGRSVMGYSFAVTFQTENGENLELYAYETEYGGLKEGMHGKLTYRGRYFVGFTNK